MEYNSRYENEPANDSKYEGERGSEVADCRGKCGRTITDPNIPQNLRWTPASESKNNRVKER